jgi:ketosteroid isomerase-like protein
VKGDATATALAELVAARDVDRLGRHLTDDVRLRALLPAGPVEVHGRAETLAAFDGWFGDHEIELQDAEGELAGDRLLVHYRLGFSFVEGPHVMTQTWVSSVGHDGRIFRIDLLCSGFRKVAP